MNKFALILCLTLEACYCANVPLNLEANTSTSSQTTSRELSLISETQSSRERDFVPLNLEAKTSTSSQTTSREFSLISETKSSRNRGFDMSNHIKIVKGHDAALGEAPWQVALFSEFGSLFCGGTLLGPRVVVTAAHCIGWSFTVQLGSLDRRELPLKYPVKEVFVHKDYNSTTYDSDIALVILDGPVNIPALEYVQTASLPTTDGDDTNYVNQTVLISGWGRLGSDSSSKPNRLQAAEVQIFSEDVCTKAYYGYQYTHNMICAGTQDYSKDTCQGDSGGPLVLQGEARNTLVGITSWGIGCAEQGYPGVYTKVDNYVPWIIEKACSSDACLNRK